MCRSAIGGIQNVYIGNYTGRSTTPMTLTIGTTASVGQVTAFAGGTVSMYTHYQPNEVASWGSAGQFSTETGTAFYEQTVEFTLHQLSAATGTSIASLGQGAWVVMVLDMLGNYYLLGFYNGMRVSGATPGAGKAMGDLNGAVITMSSKEQLPFYQVTTAAALTLITA